MLLTIKSISAKIHYLDWSCIITSCFIWL